MTEFWQAALALVLSYLLGTIPSGVVVGRLTRNVDLRDYGSGRTGATNTWRTLGWRASAVVLLADTAKGVLPVLAVRFLGGPIWLEAAAALAAIAGHDWPIYLGFRGGRGVSATGGAVIAMSPGIGTLALLLFFAVSFVFRYASVGSLVASAVALVLMVGRAWMGQEPVEYAIFLAVAVGLIVIQHRDNIARLARGTEPRLRRSSTEIQSEKTRD